MLAHLGLEHVVASVPVSSMPYKCCRPSYARSRRIIKEHKKVRKAGATASISSNFGNIKTLAWLMLAEAEDADEELTGLMVLLIAQSLGAVWSVGPLRSGEVSGVLPVHPICIIRSLVPNMDKV